ncbi:MAG TPA: permease [Thioalkalivibrio sp.]|nr:permease [Thioalkalivibrio sp.]
MTDPFQWFADWLVYGVLGLSADTRSSAALNFFVMDIPKIFFLLVVVIYVMGWLRAFVSPEQVRNYIRGRSKVAARSIAVGLGAVTPFCSCSSVPLFIGFVEAGVPLGVTFSFLIASPMINQVAVVLLAGILGWQVALLYVLAGLTLAFVGGMIMERFRPERWVEEYVWKIHMGQVQVPERDTSLRGRHLYAWGEVTEIVRRIWKWIFIGVGVGALFYGFIPGHWVENLGDHWLVVPAAVLLGIPMYSNAIGVLPVAEAMLLKGVPLGTTLAFMMSVAALSLPELLILRKVIRWPALIRFVGILAGSFVIVGWLFNALAPWLPVAATP